MTEQLEVAMLLGGGLSTAGFVRVYVTNGSLVNAFAISVSLLAIVFASVLLGTGLPFALARGGVDPAHAGTSIQVGDIWHAAGGGGGAVNAFAVSVSLLAIVFASVLLGTGLPFALARGGVDPAHAGTSIQV